LNALELEFDQIIDFLHLTFIVIKSLQVNLALIDYLYHENIWKFLYASLYLMQAANFAVFALKLNVFLQFIKRKSYFFSE
jgi:hypothetical protein